MNIEEKSLLVGTVTTEELFNNLWEFYRSHVFDADCEEDIPRDLVLDVWKLKNGDVMHILGLFKSGMTMALVPDMMNQLEEAVSEGKDFLIKVHHHKESREIITLDKDHIQW